MISLWKDTTNPDPDDVRYRGLTKEQRRHRAIEKTAFLIWINHGGGNGSDVSDWLEAEQQIDSGISDK